MIKFAIVEVATRFVIVPNVIGIISRGRSTRLTQNMPRGGIQAVLRIRSTVIVLCEMYSTHPLQKIVRIILMQGATIQPSRANRMCESDGI